jgi:tetratricopeptide (TPR) repeat protein
MNKDIDLISELFTQAIKNHQENNLQIATQLYKKIIQINPNHIKSNNNLGVLYQTLGDHQKAEGYFEKAIEIDPNHVNAHYNLGIVYEKLNENQKAIIFYEKAIEIDPNYVNAYNNLGNIFQKLKKSQKAKECYERVIEINPDLNTALINIVKINIGELNDFEKAISTSNRVLKIYHKNSKFINQSIPLFRLKHDVQQAQYLSSKNYKIEGIYEFQKIGNEILKRDENKEVENNSNKKILLDKDEINSLLPFYKSDHIYQVKNISGSCINQNKNWQDVEDEYFNSSNQIMYIDDFLSDEALQELREFCLVSKVWNKEYNNKYLGAFSEQGFISPIHLQIAIDLKQKLPKLFGPHKIERFWGFKYDATLGKGINIHADAAIHNLNFWITPDEYNSNKNSGGLKVYEAPAPDHWTFKDYNEGENKILNFLKDTNAKCTNIPYKFNRAVLFNSAYFHETDEIDFKDQYEGRRINNTYLFGFRQVKK